MPPLAMLGLFVDLLPPEYQRWWSAGAAGVGLLGLLLWAVGIKTGRVISALVMGTVGAGAGAWVALAATDFYQVLETSDMPAGVVNIVTGGRDALARTLAEHDGVDAVWYFGDDGAAIERAAAGNLKHTWIGQPRDWFDASAEGREFLRHATQVKNIWIPYGA